MTGAVPVVLYSNDSEIQFNRLMFVSKMQVLFRIHWQDVLDTL